MRCRAREIAHGSKIVAMSAPLATHLLITARSSGGLSLLFIETDSAATGIDVHNYRTVDDRRAADLCLTGCDCPRTRCWAKRARRGRR